MNNLLKTTLLAASALAVLPAGAQERNPALDLLVKKGIITAEERAQALQQAAIAKLNSPKETPWYDKLSMDGYTQVRFTEQLNDAAYLTGSLPADRSVNKDESFVIRRGRFKISGDVGRVYLYSQLDFAANNGGTTFALQARDLYADVSLDEAKEHRVRIGLSKVPYGWVNLQSSQNRLSMERPEALNSAVEGERDQGLYYMYASKESRDLFKSLVKDGLKGSGDYGVFTVGGFGGSGLNRADNNGEPHLLARLSYPWKSDSGQIYEAGVGAYSGRFKVTTDGARTANTLAANPGAVSDGFKDRRAFATFVMYPQPFGIEAEWTTGQGPQMDDAATIVNLGSLQGGYIMANYRIVSGLSEYIPFIRWNYFDGARKFATNAPKMCVNEIDIGVEWQWRKECELTLMYTMSNERSNSSTTAPAIITDSRRLALQLQFNY
ncbi:MAG: porin [Verrucomicrobiota bacterium]